MGHADGHVLGGPAWSSRGLVDRLGKIQKQFTTHEAIEATLFWFIIYSVTLQRFNKLVGNCQGIAGKTCRKIRPECGKMWAIGEMG